MAEEWYVIVISSWHWRNGSVNFLRTSRLDLRIATQARRQRETRCCICLLCEVIFSRISRLITHTRARNVMRKLWRLDQAIEMRLTLHRASSCIADAQFSPKPPLVLKNGSEKGIKREIKRGFFPSETHGLYGIYMKLCGTIRSTVY